MPARVALITGGSQGIGRAAAAALAARDYHVIVADISVGGDPAPLPGEPGLTAAHVDVTSRPSVDGLAHWVASAFGRLRLPGHLRRRDRAAPVGLAG